MMASISIGVDIVFCADFRDVMAMRVCGDGASMGVVATDSTSAAARADGDFAAVGDEDAFEHQVFLSRES